MTDDELKALVGRLRASRAAWPRRPTPLESEAATAIERLMAERDLNSRAGKLACEQLVLAINDRLAAEADNKRLREALITIADFDLKWSEGLDSNIERIKSIVRVALDEDEK